MRVKMCLVCVSLYYLSRKICFSNDESSVSIISSPDVNKKEILNSEWCKFVKQTIAYKLSRPNASTSFLLIAAWHEYTRKEINLKSILFNVFIVYDST